MFELLAKLEKLNIGYCFQSQKQGFYNLQIETKPHSYISGNSQIFTLELQQTLAKLNTTVEVDEEEYDL